MIFMRNIPVLRSHPDGLGLARGAGMWMGKTVKNNALIRLPRYNL
jgi:hypothetical protein